MGIFLEKLHRKEGSPQAPIESVDTNMLPTDEIRSARVQQLEQHASESGVIKPRDAQIAQDEAISQVSGDHEALVATGNAAEQAGHAAMVGAGIPEQSVDANHQLPAA